MRLKGLSLLVILALAAGPVPCQAYVAHTRLSLSGHHKFRAGSGTVTYTKGFGEDERLDAGTIIIEVSNVPLPAGTELIVLIHEKEVGTLTLDKERGGKLILRAKPHYGVPRLNQGSLVSLKRTSGAKVLW